MAVTLTENSKELVSRLIRNEFDKIDFTVEYIYKHSIKLIDTAMEFGLLDLADEMISDAQCELGVLSIRNYLGA